MAYDFTFPDVGEGIHEGKIVKWLVKEGDTVKMDQGLAEVETDKAVVEIPSPKAGKISKLYHKEGEVIKVGEILASIEIEGGEAPDPALAGQKQTLAQAGITEEKEAVSEPKKESTGVVGTLEETAAGVLKAPSIEQSGAVFAGLTPAQTPTVKPSPAPPQTIPAPPQTSFATTSASPQPTLKVIKKYDLFGYVDRVKYDSMRKAVGDHMVKSIFTAPHVTHTDLVDVTKLWRIREKEKIKAAKLETTGVEADGSKGAAISPTKGIKLTFLPFFIKAVIAGLKKHPFLNAGLDESVPEIILKKYYNIGIAVDTQAGLMVPVIKGADKKSILELAKEIQELAAKARAQKLNPMDMKGGTFTITNIGSAGGGFLATPVINYPEAAILGTGMIQDMPVARKGKVVIRKILPLMVTFDHRILDGAEAARFAITVKEHLENPDLMLVEGK